jgi:hypothetical protein
MHVVLPRRNINGRVVTNAGEHVLLGREGGHGRDTVRVEHGIESGGRGGYRIGGIVEGE